MKGKCEGNVHLVLFICCAVKGIFIPELELTSTEDALKRERYIEEETLCENS